MVLPPLTYDSASNFGQESPTITPFGITFGNDRFWLVESRKVSAYHSNGTRDTDSDFDLDSENQTSADGITFWNDRLWVTDITHHKVFAYHSNGTRDADSDFDLLYSASSNPSGITFGNNRFWIVDYNINRVFAYHSDGTRDTDSDFDLDSENDRPTGIMYVSDRIFVTDQDFHVYEYSDDGLLQVTYRLDTDTVSPIGITFANNRIRIVSSSTGMVSAYKLPVRKKYASKYSIKKTVTESVSSEYAINEVITNSIPSQYAIQSVVTKANESEYVIRERLYGDIVYDADFNFTTAAGNTNPSGLTFAKNRILVSDLVDDKIYVYKLNEEGKAVREDGTDSDIALDIDLFVRGITFDRNTDRLWVLDSNKVIAYILSENEDGDLVATRDMDSDFDHIVENIQGITFWNNRLWIVNGESSTNKVFAYNPDTKSRDSDSDFELDEENDHSGGITFGNNRFWITDGNDDKIYAHFSDGRRDSNFDINEVYPPDNPNINPNGVTFANNRLWIVTDNNPDRVLVHRFVSGERYASEYSIKKTVTKTIPSEYAINEVITNTIESQYTIEDIPQRILFHDNDTNEIIAYLIKNNSLVPDQDFTFTYPEDAFGIASQGKDLWSVINFGTSAKKYNTSGQLLDEITLNSANFPEQGLEYHNGILYVLNAGGTRSVYKYNTTNGNEVGNFGVTVGNPRSISIRNDTVYISTLATDRLYAHDLDGIRIAAMDFIIPTSITNVRAMVITGNYVVITDDVSIYLFSFSNFVQGETNTPVATLTHNRNIQGSTHQIFYPIKRIQSEYSITNLVTNAVKSEYTIEGIITKTIPSEYAINEVITNSIPSEYTIEGIITKTIPSEYAINEVITNSIPSEYTIEGIITKSFESQYTIDAVITKNTSSQYSILDVISKSNESEYSVNEIVTNAIESQYVIGGTLTKTIPSEYAINEVITNTIESQYTIEDIPQRILFHDNDTNEIIAYLIKNNSLVPDQDFTFTYPEDAFGIASQGKDLWSVINFGTSAKKYNTSGQLLDEITLNSANFPEQGLEYHNGILYVLNAGGTRSIYKYDVNNGNEIEHFDITVGNPRSILIKNNVLYISTLNTDRLYAHDLNGNRISEMDFILPSTITNVRGMAVSNNWIVLVDDVFIYLFSLENFVEGATNTPITTLANTRDIQGATSQIFYPIKRIQSEYSITNLVTNAVKSEYTIEGIITKTIPSEYAINEVITNSIPSEYTIEGIITKTIPSEYAINEVITNSIPSEYTIEGIITKSFESQYTIDAVITKNTSSQYSILDVISKSNESEYSVNEIVTNAIESQYVIGGTLTKTIPSEYSILDVITENIPSEYSIDQIITNSVKSVYSVVKVITKSIQSAYRIGRIPVINRSIISFPYAQREEIKLIGAP